MGSRDIKDCVKLLQDQWPEIVRQYATIQPIYHLVITESYRAPEEQFALYKKGRKQLPTGEWVVENKDEVVTNVDGYKNIGAHNYHPSRAIDVAVIDNQTGKAIWEESHYKCLVEIASAVGLESGGTWRAIKDWPHLQVPNFKNYHGD